MPVSMEDAFHDLDRHGERAGSQYLVTNFGIYHRVAYRVSDNGGWFDSLSFRFFRSPGSTGEKLLNIYNAKVYLGNL